jgi:Spy/CpxP family protein refolding chaperone
MLCAILAALPAGAEPVLDSVPTLENISKRLNLTAEQEAQLKPLFQSRAVELGNTQHELQQASTDQQKRDILRAAKQAGDAFNAQVESLLTPAQRNEWHEIRSEAREKIKEHIDEKRSGG